MVNPKTFTTLGKESGSYGADDPRPGALGAGQNRRLSAPQAPAPNSPGVRTSDPWGHFPPGAVQAQVTEHRGSLGTYGFPLLDTCSKTAREEKRGKAKCLLLLPSRLCVLSFRDVLPEYRALPQESALTWGDGGMGGDWEVAVIPTLAGGQSGLRLQDLVRVPLCSLGVMPESWGPPKAHQGD